MNIYLITENFSINTEITRRLLIVQCALNYCL